MAPIYVFRCEPCDYQMDELRKMGDYEPPDCNQCGQSTYKIITTSTLHLWNSERRFPNVGNTGDGTMTFESKGSYESHLKANHVAESATDAPAKVKSTAEVTVY